MFEYQIYKLNFRGGVHFGKGFLHSSGMECCADTFFSALFLEAMKKAGEPLNAGKAAELTGLDRKVVDKAFAQLKKEGAIVSPVRCKWEPAEK